MLFQLLQIITPQKETKLVFNSLNWVSQKDTTVT